MGSRAWYTMGIVTTAVILTSVIQGIFALRCEVGVNNETSAMECEGSWDKMQEKMGGKWEEMKTNLTGDMTGVIGQLKAQFEDLKNKLQNVLTPKTGEERRKREVSELVRVKRGEEPAAEPEPEPEGDQYYCIKKSLAGNTVKSCLPKSVADPLQMACGHVLTVGTVCVCNDSDLCNRGNIRGWSAGVLGLIILAVLYQ